MKRLWLLIFISNLGISATDPGPVSCLSTREFITTLEFLRTHKEYQVTEDRAQSLSQQVADGCTGASKRFIQIMNVLSKAGIPSQKSVETALHFASSTQEMTKAFLTIFKGAFIENLMDLDSIQALNISMEISEAYKDHAKSAEKNFNQLVDFCVSKKSLDLPILECAKFGTRVIKNGSTFEFNITKDFIELFNYLTDKNKSNLPTYEALKISEFVTQFGPESKSNFIKAYEYALEKNGLDKSIKESIELGKQMASKSIKKI